MVDRPRAELDGEGDRARLGELVAVQPQREPCVAAGSQVAAGLLGVEGAALEEDVGGLGELRRLREHLPEEEVEVRVGAGVRELGRDSVRAEPRRDATGIPNDAKLRELGVAVEPVSGLGLERRRPRPQHPVDVLGERPP